jgi:predicted lipid-binding transport protein (Tim44 family)
MSSLVIHILAAAGGGSGGFGGGGGGGGGGFGGGGGSGSGGHESAQTILIIIVASAALVLFMTYVFNPWYVRRQSRGAAPRDVTRRVEQTKLAALEAETDDADFDPDTVRSAASALFLEIQERWSENDITALESLVGADLMVEWRRRLQDFDRKGWHNKVQPHGEPAVEYVGLVNREGDHEDRVVVRLSASCEDYVIDAAGDQVLKNNATSTTTTLDEY